MKRIIPIIIVTSIIIVSALRTCRSGDDDVSDTNNSTPQIPVNPQLRLCIDSFITASPSVGSLGLAVYDITAQQTIYAHHADIPMRPASCMKLLSCIATLRYVGTKYKYLTRLYTEGTVANDTLYGNLILKTQFDPFFNHDSLYVLTKALKDKNIKAIKGRVKLDMAFTEPMEHEQHWIIGDLKVNKLGLTYQGYNKLRTEVQHALQVTSGIIVHKDSVLFGRLIPKKSTMISQTATPLQYPIEKALKNSSNINAESLMFLLGYTVNTGGNFRENGKKALEKFIKEELKMEPAKECSIEDGCGLCPDNRLTPNILITLLNYAYKHPAIYSSVIAGLPLAGKDGTLHDRLTKLAVAGKINAKTGTLTREGGISTLAGYFTGTDGHLIAFAIMNNECPVMDGRWWQDKFCETILKCTHSEITN